MFTYIFTTSATIPGPRCCYAGELISKRSFIPTVRLAVQTNPSRKRSFSKTLFKLDEFENDGLVSNTPFTLTKHV